MKLLHIVLLWADKLVLYVAVFQSHYIQIDSTIVFVIMIGVTIGSRKRKSLV
jgi:hypothetical protein